MPTRRRSLDTRTLQPRSYLADPSLFGADADAPVILPVDGDLVSQQVAMVQHRLACQLRSRSDRRLATAVTTRFGFSKQLWSSCLHGRSWMGETVLAAATLAALEPDHRDPVRP